MFVLGVNGGRRRIDETDPDGMYHHDAAAVILRDGELLAAIEEERLNRIKHSNSFPEAAISHCLDAAGVTLAEIDIIAINSSIDHSEREAKLEFFMDRQLPSPPSARLFWGSAFQRAFGVDVHSKLHFCHHHLAHAISAWLPSGFEKGLVLTLDGDGDGCSGMVLVGANHKIEIIHQFTVEQSLGRLYSGLIRLLGYELFDEYKVMGLAPYGDHGVFADLFQRGYKLLPNGNYFLAPLWVWIDLLDAAGLLAQARRDRSPITEMHKHFAAGLQFTIEKIVLHVVKFYRQKTQLKNLCFAGGVAHNCSLNGKILFSGLFDNVFVQPAAHDAGGALGAALDAWMNKNPGKQLSRVPHLYWGTSVGTNSDILKALSAWKALISYRFTTNVVSESAQRLAKGAVIGWVQGRSEFGPRALGNRSILADPRPFDNRLRINQMIKAREEFRPFAPSILEESLDRFFVAPENQKQFPFMVFVLPVRDEVRELLAAVTHIDGTARVQTVSKATNEIYWNLINEFNELTSVPVLLNTSMNCADEPIVDSVNDAVTCFLTTDIDLLVIGEFIIEKKTLTDPINRELMGLIPTRKPNHKLLRHSKASTDDNSIYYLQNDKDPDKRRRMTCLSEQVFDLLSHSNGRTNLETLLVESRVERDDLVDDILAEMMLLWKKRLITFTPAR